MSPMASPDSRKLAGALWFVAAAVALAAIVVAYVRRGEVRWYLVAAVVFLVAMGASALRTPAPPPGRP